MIIKTEMVIIKMMTKSTILFNDNDGDDDDASGSA